MTSSSRPKCPLALVRVELRCPPAHCREKGCGRCDRKKLASVWRRPGDPLRYVGVCPAAAREDAEITIDFDLPEQK
jgi:hypothetical protein